MPITGSRPPALKRQYPHVDDIQDWRAQQSLRLLWERVFDLEARLQGVEATQGDLVNATNAQEDAVTLADRKADEALALAQLLEGAGAGEPGGPVVGGPLVWGWIDMTPSRPAGVAPGSPGGAPVTLTDWRDYFLSILTPPPLLGDPADDYEDRILELVAAGIKVNPTPWEIPSAAWPFFGMAVMIDGGGHPRGRLWLPTETPDALGYYTHEIQFIEAAP